MLFVIDLSGYDLVSGRIKRTVGGMTPRRAPEMRAALPWFRREGRNETLIPCKGTCALKQCTPSPVASTADRDIQGCSDGPGSPNSPANERNSVEFTYGDAHAAIVGK
jgi:hypothetical protein